MIGVNPLGTKVLITVDEVLFHAPTEGTADPRIILQSIINAERRFIKPMLGATVYNALITAKNQIVTADNLTDLQTALNASREDGRDPIVLKVGDYVNSDTFLDVTQKPLWNDYLHKIVAECVYFAALPTNRSRFSATGITVSNPPSITSSASTASIALADLKHLMDNGLQQRISPLMEDFHQYMCTTAYPGYDKDCGCNSSGVPYVSKRSSVILGMYDDDDEDCKKCYVK